MNGWGNYPQVDSRRLSFRSEAELAGLLTAQREVIPYGLGRSYGDSALASHQMVCNRWNRMLSFNEELGVLVCESGVSLGEIVETFAPRGWFPSVTPGTKHVTVGGAIASNVHGKNHHKVGCFGEHVLWLKMMLADGTLVHASPEENRELFAATCGGMGLTGIILEAALRLQPIETPWVVQRSRRLHNLEQVMDAFEANGQDIYSVAWIDCLKIGRDMGRGILLTGEHATAEQVVAIGAPQNVRSLEVPFFFPEWVLNPLSVRLFNQLYYHRAGSSDQQRFATIDQFFYPLDAMGNWNRIYGRRGFLQYQFVLPLEAGRAGLAKALDIISASGQGSFLAVLKLLGKESGSPLGFPMEGWTLALDFPATSRVFKLLNYLDALVLDYGGRLYLTKDARMQTQTFQRSYHKLELFRAIKAKVDPERRFASLQSKRLGLT